jgi:hypothetical protein
MPRAVHSRDEERHGTGDRHPPERVIEKAGTGTFRPRTTM